MGTGEPALLVVDDDPDALRELEQTLRRRYGADYFVLAEGSPAGGLARLEDARRRGEEVALLLADQTMAGMTGIEFLTRAHALHPGAKRALLISYGDRRQAEPIYQATTLGQIDDFIAGPWASPEERLYPQTEELLGEWWREHRPQFEFMRVVGHQWAPRSHELRDLLDRNGLAYGFYAVESAEGARLAGELGLEAAQLPAVVFHDGRVLPAPTNAEVAAAVGASVRPDVDACDLAIVGAGPAGLAAAVYAASEGLETVVIEREALGGQAGSSSLIRNYLGFPGGLAAGS